MRSLSVRIENLGNRMRDRRGKGDAVEENDENNESQEKGKPGGTTGGEEEELLLLGNQTGARFSS